MFRDTYALAVLLLLAGCATREGVARLEKQVDHLGDVIVWSELPKLRPVLHSIRTRYEGLDLKSDRREELLVALSAVESSLNTPNLDAFGAAAQEFAQVLQDGNSVPPWDVECTVIFLECVAAGWPLELCAVAFFLCMQFCDGELQSGGDLATADEKWEETGDDNNDGIVTCSESDVNCFYTNTDRADSAKVSFFVQNKGECTLFIELHPIGGGLDDDVIEIEPGERKRVRVTVPARKELCVDCGPKSERTKKCDYVVKDVRDGL